MGDRRLLGRFWTFARPHQPWLWGAALLLPVGTLCQLAGPLIIKVAVDEHLRPGAWGALRWDVLAFLGVLVGEYAARAGERYCMVRCGILTLRDVRRAMMAHLIAQPVAMFERRPLGSLVSRITSDVEALMETLSTGVVTIVSDLVVLGGIVLAMAWLDLRLTAVTIATTLPLAFVVDWYRRRLRTDYDRVRRHTGRMNGVLNETIMGAREMQLFNYEGVMRRRFGEANAAYFRDNMRIVASDATLYSLVDAMGILTIGVMAWVGSGQVLSGAVTVGVVVAFLTYIHRFYTPLKEFSSKVAILQGGLAAIHRIVELLDHDERPIWGGAPTRAGEPAVEFAGVSFVYPQRSGEAARREAEPLDRLYALRDVSFRIAPGERVAIVGWTGSGKSTIAKLLAGLYAPLRGEVRLDGGPVRSYDPAALRRRVGLVPQDVTLVADTVAFNIGLGAPDVSRARIEAACRIVQADAFIRRLPDGYDTMVAPGGRNLSQGQRQLLAFARVLAWSPALVILDEATASVDSRSEQLIQKAVLEVLRRKTTLVIAHRLATVQHVDRLLVLHDGRVVETGTHETLMRQAGYYRDLVEAQLTEHTP